MMVEEDWGVLAEMQMSEVIKKNSYFAQDCLNRSLSLSPDKSQPEKENSEFDPDSLSTSVYKSHENQSESISKDDHEYEEEEEDDLSLAEYSLLRKILRTRLLDSKSEVIIEKRNDNSPLYSVKSFEQLKIPRNLLRGIYAMGFNVPSKIQETSLPTLMANPPVNMIAQAQSGTGKTASFLLASLSRVNTEEEYPQVLILSPTYELALQNGEVAKTMAKFCPDITFRFAVRGEQLPRGEIIKEHIVIGTPGKVFDWVRRFHHFDIKKVRVFVLDEADVMISTQGHHDQCIRIHSMLSQECQMLLFSATYTKEVMDFAEQIIFDPVIIRLRREEETLDNVQQYYITTASYDDKYSALMNIYGAISVGQTIIFCRKKVTAAWLGQKLTDDGHSVGYLSGDLSVEERHAAITRFREGIEKVLITTNVTARGIDIEQVTMVINFDLPVFVNGHADCETYLHRIGRTGRFGKSGIAVNLVSGSKDEEILNDIQKHFGKPILPINASNADDLEGLN